MTLWRRRALRPGFDHQAARGGASPPTCTYVRRVWEQSATLAAMPRLRHPERRGELVQLATPKLASSPGVSSTQLVRRERRSARMFVPADGDGSAPRARRWRLARCCRTAVGGPLCSRRGHGRSWTERPPCWRRDSITQPSSGSGSRSRGACRRDGDGGVRPLSIFVRAALGSGRRRTAGVPSHGRWLVGVRSASTHSSPVRGAVAARKQ